MVLLSAFEFWLITPEIEKLNSAVCTQIWNNYCWKPISRSLLCNYGDTASGKCLLQESVLQRPHQKRLDAQWTQASKQAAPPPPRLLFSNFLVERQTILFIDIQMILALIENQMKIASIQGVSPHNRVVLLDELCCQTHRASMTISPFKECLNIWEKLSYKSSLHHFSPTVTSL